MEQETIPIYSGRIKNYELGIKNKKITHPLCCYSTIRANKRIVTILKRKTAPRILETAALKLEF